jgi:hypothetical protein
LGEIEQSEMHSRLRVRGYVNLFIAFVLISKNEKEN